MVQVKTAKSASAQIVDQHVGERLRMKRIELGFSQTELGNRLGITFQQVQKYEKGSNRIGASRLWRISQALEVPVSWFFEGLDKLESTTISADASAITKLIGSRDGLKFVLALNDIEDAVVRRELLRLLRALARQSSDY